MLDLMDGGRCMSGLDAVDFFEMLAAGEDIDIDAKTPEFCDDYEHALNCLRYEVRKSVPVPPKVIKAQYPGHADRYSCGACGFSLSPSDLAIYHYCPNCGREIDKKRTDKK
jgi:predicted RNA-binding Zn-ribbon protein involved in translation (DUF1610 family)